MSTFDQRGQWVDTQYNIAGDLVQIDASAAVSLHQLPSPPADFTGRTAELEELQAALEDHQGVAICGLRGLGGIGKTALALKLAEDLTPRYPDAQFFLDLKGTSPEPLSAADAMAHVIRAYHPAAKLPESESELSGLYRSVLHGQRALLLMDNAADAEQVAPLIPPAGCLLLVTSRRHFTLPGLVAQNLDTLPPADAQVLLLRIAARIGEYAGDLAHLCGYLPLALRLAGSALAERVDLSPAGYLRRLADAQTRLDLVDASLDLSYQLLDPEMQRLWRMLAIFPGTFDQMAAGAVWELEPDPAQDALSELVRYSLVAWDPVTRRYRLHDLAHLFADARLDEVECTLGEQRHAVHYVSVARAARELYEQGSENVLQGLALFDLEWNNIQAGQVWAAAHMEEDDTATRLCSAYSRAGLDCLDLRQHPQVRIDWLDAAVAAASRLKDRRHEEEHLCNLGNAYNDLGQVGRAIEYHQGALAIARVTGDRQGESIVLGELGSDYSDLGQFQRAIELYEQALSIAREVDDQRGEGTQLGNLGLAYRNLGDVEKAIECHQQAFATARKMGDRRSEAHQLGNLGLAYHEQGRKELAIEYHEQALAIARKLGDRRGEAADLGNLGIVYDEMGQLDRAIQCHEQALKIHREMSDRRGEGIDLGNLGNAYSDLDQMEQAIQYHQQALVIARELDDWHSEGLWLANLGFAYRRLRQVPQARECLVEALAILENIESSDAERVRSWLAELREE